MLKTICTIAVLAIATTVTGCATRSTDALSVKASGGFHAMEKENPVAAVLVLPKKRSAGGTLSQTICPAEFNAAVSILTHAITLIRAQLSTPAEAGTTNAVPILIQGPLGLTSFVGRYYDGVLVWNQGMSLSLSSYAEKLRELLKANDPIYDSFTFETTFVRSLNTPTRGIAVSEVGCDAKPIDSGEVTKSVPDSTGK